MSLFRWRRRGPQQRAVTFSTPPIPSNLEAGLFGGVDLTRVESSLQKIAMWSSVDLIASLGSELPVDVFRGTGRSRVPVPMPSYLRDPAGDGYGLEDWIDQFLRSCLLRGNVYGRTLARDSRAGFATQVLLLHPDEVSGWRDGDGRKQWRVNGRKVEDEDMWHRRVYPVPGQLLGLSPVAYHAMTIGLGLTAQRFGVQWFTDGAHPSALLTNEEIDLKQSVAKVAKDRFLAAVRGSREPVVMGRGWKYQAIQIAPNESQFLETQKYTSAECARLYGPGLAEILGYETGNSLTYQTLEGRLQHLLVLAVNRWFRRAERALTSMLPRDQYVKINRAAMLQSTTLERFRVHQIALRNRVKTVNEVRDHEDMRPVAWGDTPNPIGPASKNDDDGGGTQ